MNCLTQFCPRFLPDWQAIEWFWRSIYFKTCSIFGLHSDSAWRRETVVWDDSESVPCWPSFIRLQCWFSETYLVPSVFNIPHSSTLLSVVLCVNESDILVILNVSVFRSAQIALPVSRIWLKVSTSEEGKFNIRNLDLSPIFLLLHTGD